MTKNRIVLLMVIFLTMTFTMYAGGQKEESAEVLEPVELAYMTWDYADRTISSDSLIQVSNERFNIEIDMVNTPGEQYKTTLKTRIVSNDIPDLVKVHGITSDYILYGSEISPDLFLDISDLDSVKEYLPATIEGVRASGGELYYMPVSLNALGAIYNKDVFEANGLSVPTNIKELEIVLEALKSAGVVPIAAGFKDSWTTQILPFIAFGQFINENDWSIGSGLGDGSVKYADIRDEITKVLMVQKDFEEKGYFQKDSLGTDINIASAMVGTGKAALLINGTWQYKAVQDANPDANIGFFPLPLNEPGEDTITPTATNEGICINAGSENLEAAKKVLNYYMSAENQNKVIADLNGIPTNINVKVNNPFVSTVQDALSSTVVHSQWWGQKSTGAPATSTFSKPNHFQALIAGTETIDEFIAEYDRLNEKALSE